MNPNPSSHPTLFYQKINKLIKIINENYVDIGSKVTSVA